VLEGTNENSNWSCFDAEKLFGYLELVREGGLASMTGSWGSTNRNSPPGGKGHRFHAERIVRILSHEGRLSFPADLCFNRDAYVVHSYRLVFIWDDIKGSVFRLAQAKIPGGLDP
jgi:hypothetical protein